jgi:hypothetical protein
MYLGALARRTRFARDAQPDRLDSEPTHRLGCHTEQRRLVERGSGLDVTPRSDIASGPPWVPF